MANISKIAGMLIDEYRSLVRRGERGNGIEQGTLDTFLVIWKRLEPFFKNIECIDAPDKWVSYKAYCQRKFPTRKHDHDLRYLKQILKAAVRLGKIDKVNVYEYLSKVDGMKLNLFDEAVRDPEINLYSRDEIRLMLCDAPTRLKLIIYLAVVTGMRLSEILKLKWSYIDWTNRRINLPPRVTKTKTGRSFPVTEAIYLQLNSLQVGRRGTFCFPSDSNHRLPLNRHATGFRALKKKLGIEKRFHDFRHTNISHLIKKGYPMEYICHTRGVSRKVVEKIYMHVKSDTLREMNESVESSLGITEFV